MIPKTVLRYSIIYNKLFDNSFTNKKFEKLKKDFRKFEKLYNKYILGILKLIEKHHSKKWRFKFIPIYLVNNKFPMSFSNPLTIKYRKSEKYLLIVLAHELLHNNLIGLRFKNPKECHVFMEPILNKIISELPINLSKELNLFNKRIHKMYNIK